MSIKLQRLSMTESGTFGGLLGENGIPICLVLERPWVDNKPNISCIPPGLYRCELVNSPTFGWTYQVVDVPNRTKILFHVGNWIENSRGCLLTGSSFGILNSKPAVINSSKAFAGFIKYLDNAKTFDIEIFNPPDKPYTII